MYCMVFVTVCKIKIPHKGCYFAYGNIVLKTKIVLKIQFKIRSVVVTIFHIQCKQVNIVNVGSLEVKYKPFI